MNIDPINHSTICSLIPAILGFVPTDSIVVVHLHSPEGHPEVRLIARIDLDSPPQLIAEHLDAMQMKPHHGEAVILVVVTPADNSKAAGDQLAAVSKLIADRGVAVISRLHTEQLAEAGHWNDVDTGQSGPIDCYRDTALAAAMAVQGRGVMTSRDAIAAEFDTDEPAPAPEAFTDPDEFTTQILLRYYAVLAGEATPTPQLVADFGGAITDTVHLRDALLVISLEDTSRAAVLWTHFARQLRGPARIEALSLAAACYYAADDGVRAGLALQAAHRTARDNTLPVTRLVLLIEAALDAAIPPETFRNTLRNITVSPPPAGT